MLASDAEEEAARRQRNAKDVLHGRGWPLTANRAKLLACSVDTLSGAWRVSDRRRWLVAAIPGSLVSINGGSQVPS